MDKIQNPLLTRPIAPELLCNKILLISISKEVTTVDTKAKSGTGFSLLANLSLQNVAGSHLLWCHLGPPDHNDLPLGLSGRLQREVGRQRRRKGSRQPVHRRKLEMEGQGAESSECTVHLRKREVGLFQIPKVLVSLQCLLQICL